MLVAMKRPVTETQYRILFDANPQPMFVSDADTLEILAVNEAAVARYGWSRAEFLRMNLRDLRPPEDVPAFIRAKETLPTSGIQKGGTWRHRHKDGAVVWVEVTFQVIAFEGRKARLAVAVDVTEQVRAREALVESEVRHRRLTENSSVGIWEVTPDRRTVYVNPALCAMVEVESASELVGRPLDPYFTPESVARIAAELKKRESNVVSSYEVELVSKKGRHRTVVITGAPLFDADGALQATIGTIVDVTESRRTQRELESQTRILNAVITRMSDGVVVADEHGKFLLFNPAAERIAGVGAIASSPERWQADYGIFRPDRRTPFPSDELPLARAIRGESLDQVELFLKNASRPEGVSISISGRPLRTDAGELAGAVVVFRDITEQRRLEAGVRQAHKMEAIGRLAGGVAHDFGTMIAAIRMYARAVHRDLAADDPRRADLEQIIAASDHATSLARRLLNFSRGTAVSPTLLDLNEVVRAIEPLLRPLVGRTIELAVDPRATRPVVRADQGQMEQVVLNLVVNARDAMPVGGRVSIATENVEVDAAQARKLGLAAPGTYVRLTVADSGTGMDLETQSHIFEPYFTTKPSGTGLGLFTTYGILRQAGGHIAVRSAPGKGATFDVILPCVAEESRPGTSTAKTPRRQDAPRKKRRRK